MGAILNFIRAPDPMASQSRTWTQSLSKFFIIKDNKHISNDLFSIMNEEINWFLSLMYIKNFILSYSFMLISLASLSPPCYLCKQKLNKKNLKNKKDFFNNLIFKKN